MQIDVITIFPEILKTFFEYGMVSQAVKRNRILLNAHNLRNYAEPPHYQVDDYPYGGGDGMILKVEPIVSAVEALKKETTRLLITSPQGRVLDQKYLIELCLEKHILIICGRYKDVDNRIYEILQPEEFSLGSFILSGGEVAAMALIEGFVRLLPGVAKDSSSILQDSLIQGEQDFIHYTRPRNFRGFTVPEVLLSGHEEKIKEWREKHRHKNKISDEEIY